MRTPVPLSGARQAEAVPQWNVTSSAATSVSSVVVVVLLASLSINTYQ